MKIFVISDIHGSLVALEKALEAFNKEKADYLLICGDFLNHGPRNAIPEGYNTMETVKVLNQYKEKILAVRGNCDSEVDQMILEFPMLPDYLTIILNNGNRIFVHHGHLYTEEYFSKFLTEKNIILSGHTHIPELEIKKINNKNFIIMNPGSISIPKGVSLASYGIIEEEGSKIKLKICELSGNVVKSIDI